MYLEETRCPLAGFLGKLVLEAPALVMVVGRSLRQAIPKLPL